MTYFTWILVVLSLIGVVLNIEKKRAGFVFWMFSNAGWAFVDFYHNIPAQGCLMLLYFSLAVWGYFKWK